MRVPIAFAFGLTGFLGIWYVRGFAAALGDLPVTAWNNLSNYALACLPLFILMGEFANYSGIGPDLYKSALRWWWRDREGLSIWFRLPELPVACSRFRSAHSLRISVYNGGQLGIREPIRAAAVILPSG